MTTEKEPILVLTDTPGAEAEAVIRDGLSSYNSAQAGYRDHRPLAVLASDPDNGEVIGGLIGRTSMGLLFIDRFFLPESWRKRGLGSQLIKMAEEEGARRGCARAVLFTVHFQALGFYLRQGYEVGRLDLDLYDQEARPLTQVHIPGSTQCSGISRYTEASQGTACL
jgi:GNAT superfamily N-acetyltransferase